MAKLLQNQLAHLLMARAQLNRQVSQRYGSRVSQRFWDLLQLAIDPLTRRHDEVTTQDPSIVCSTHNEDDTLSIHNPELVGYAFIKDDVALSIESFVESNGSNPSLDDVLIQNDELPNKFWDNRVQKPWCSHDASFPEEHAFPDFQHYPQIYQQFSNFPKKFSLSSVKPGWNLSGNKSGIDFGLTSSSNIQNCRFHPTNVRCYRKSTRHGKIARSKRVKNKKKKRCRKSSLNKTHRESIHTESSIKYSKPDDNQKPTEYLASKIKFDDNDPKRPYSTAVIFHTNISKRSPPIEYYTTPKPPDGECTERPDAGDGDSGDTDTRRKKELEKIEKCKDNIKGNTSVKRDTNEKKT